MRDITRDEIRRAFGELCERDRMANDDAGVHPKPNFNERIFDGNGINQWLEYFTEGVRVSILRVKEKVLQLSLERQKQREKGQIALTERQMKIVEFIQRNGQISSGDIQRIFKISRQAAYEEIKKLIELDIIEKKGSGKAIYYVLK